MKFSDSYAKLRKVVLQDKTYAADWESVLRNGGALARFLDAKQPKGEDSQILDAVRAKLEPLPNDCQVRNAVHRQAPANTVNSCEFPGSGPPSSSAAS